jgi:hypothetical protein
MTGDPVGSRTNSVKRSGRRALSELKVNVELSTTEFSATTIGVGHMARMRRAAVVALALLTLEGCAGRNPFLSYGPSPRAEDCAQIQQATPTKYVCGGKIYTSVQLTAIKNGEQNQ